MPKTNAAGRHLIETFEGCSLHAYWDRYGGVWTIEYGHTGSDVHEGQVITQAQADALLADDLARFEECVTGAVSHDITPNQFAALVSFAYNLGCASPKESTLLSYVNEANYQAVQGEFGKWVSSGGVILQGLVRRRAAEAKLFATR